MWRRLLVSGPSTQGGMRNQTVKKGAKTTRIMVPSVQVFRPMIAALRCLPQNQLRNMKESPGKNNILKKIKQALAEPVPVPFAEKDAHANIFTTSNQDPEV